VPGEIKPVDHNPVVKCQHCTDTRQHLSKECFLAPLSAAVTADRSAGPLAVVAGLIAAVKLARVDSRELHNRNPRVRSAIADVQTIALLREDRDALQKRVEELEDEIRHLRSVTGEDLRQIELAWSAGHLKDRPFRPQPIRA
jgi:hypothetical protein